MQAYNMDYMTDTLVLLAVKQSGLLRSAIYTSLQAATIEFPKLLTLCSVFYWSVLYEDSRNKIDTLLKSKMPSVLYRKFNILTQVMKAEQMTIDTFLSALENLKQLKEKLPMIGVNIDLNTDGLKRRITDQVNMHVDDIIKLLENYMKTIEGYLKIDEYFKKAQEILKPDELSKMRQEAQAQALNSVVSLNLFNRGGTKRKRRRTRRRKGGEEPNQNNMFGKIVAPAAYEAINRANFNYWYGKDTKKYPSYNGKFYYPSAINAYNPLNARFRGTDIKPELWVNRVKRHCGKKSEKNIQDFRLCVSRKCAPGDGEYVDGSSCNLNTYKD